MSDKLLNMLKKKKPSFVTTTVSTFDADLEFNIDPSWKTRKLLDLVAHTLGLRETKLFGIAYDAKIGTHCWLKLDKKIVDQVPPGTVTEDRCLHLHFYAKFYPENIEEELIQDITCHLFYLQFQRLIWRGMLSCDAEASLLLTSLAIQAEYGDFDSFKYDEGEEGKASYNRVCETLCPEHIAHVYDTEEARAQIRKWHKSHVGMCKQEAKLEFIKIVHDFEMSGITYFKVQDGNGIAKWLGIQAKSVAIYHQDDKVHPIQRIEWNSLAGMNLNGSKFIIKHAPQPSKIAMGENLNRRIRLMDNIPLVNVISVNSIRPLPEHASTDTINQPSAAAAVDTDDTNAASYGDLNFMADNPEICKLILDLCQGNFDLYMERRVVGCTIERQQMLARAKEEKARRERDRERARQIRLDMERMQNELDAWAERYAQIENKYNKLFEALTRVEEEKNLNESRAESLDEMVSLYKRQVAKNEQEHANALRENEALRVKLSEKDEELEHAREEMAEFKKADELKNQELEMLSKKLHRTENTLNDQWNYLKSSGSSANMVANNNLPSTSSLTPSNAIASSSLNNIAQAHTSSYNQPPQQQQFQHPQQQEMQMWTAAPVGQNSSYMHVAPASNLYQQQQQQVAVNGAQQQQPPSQQQQKKQFYIHSTSSSFSDAQQLDQQQQQQQHQSMRRQQYQHLDDNIHCLSLQIQNKNMDYLSQSNKVKQEIEKVKSQLEQVELESGITLDDFAEEQQQSVPAAHHHNGSQENLLELSTPGTNNEN